MEHRPKRYRHDHKCSRCGGERETDHRWCRACKAKWAREHRPTYAELPLPERRAANARSYANTYQRRGKLLKQPCEDCANPNSQKHHPDYSKPLEVIWLCRSCHTAEHRGERMAPAAIAYQRIRRELLAA